jgi:hypothetical protein
MRLTQASTNYVAMGERGYDALTGLVRSARRLRWTIRMRTPRSS